MLPLSTTIHIASKCQESLGSAGSAVQHHVESVCVWTSLFGGSTVSFMFPSHNHHLIGMITWACCLSTATATSHFPTISALIGGPFYWLSCKSYVPSAGSTIDDCWIAFLIAGNHVPSVFWGLSPSKPGLFQQNNGNLTSEYILTVCYTTIG